MSLLRSNILALAILLLTQSFNAALALVTVSVQPAPALSQVGSTLMLTGSVSVTSGEIITGYSWLVSSDGVGPSRLLPFTNNLCVVSNAQLSDAGFYYMRVNYKLGTVTGSAVSTAAQIIVQDQARILTQPQGVYGLIGGEAAFEVEAAGQTPMHYWWTLNGVKLADDARLSGTATRTLRVQNLISSDSGAYQVVVSNVYASVTSAPAILTLRSPLQVISEPGSISVIDGSNMTLTVVAEGTDILYQWYKDGAALANSERISGSAEPVLGISTATTNDSGAYQVIVWDDVTSFTSSVAQVKVLVPATFTSPDSALGRQGALFDHQIVAVGTLPITFGVSGLPEGLALQADSGLVSGVPSVSGLFDLVFFATNAAMTTTQNFVLTLTTGVPGITSASSASGKQGHPFSYRIRATNSPAWFTVTNLPQGLQLDTQTGRITGIPLVSGNIPVTMVAGNAYGQDARELVLNLASSAPLITSPLVATGVENESGFSYQIEATENPLVFGVSGLPLGLDFDQTTGQITGTPLYGGPFNIVISAANAWGTSKTNLLLNIEFATLNGLAITQVTNIYSSPYLLDFAFSLRDDTNAANGNPVIRPVSEIQVICLEDGQPVKSEAPLILERGSQKQMKMFLGLDYTWSMLSVPGAIEAMEEAAKNLIRVSPRHAQFGVVEFHAEYEDPIMVADLTSDKETLNQYIDGIEENQVKGNYAGTRCWDAVLLALNKFGPFDPETHRDEQRFIVVMSDGNDASSLINTNATPLDTIVALAQTNRVRIYCVALGSDIDTNALQQLTSQTMGRYYEAATTADLPLQFTRIARDLDGQYLLRWATLRRAPVEFQPSFVITVDGFTASFNTNVVYETNYTIITNVPPDPDITNTTVTHITEVPQYDPAKYAGDVRVGSLLLVADAAAGPQVVRLRASYVPRYVREIRIRYQPNYPCAPQKSSSGPGEFLEHWSMEEFVETNGIRVLTLRSPDTTNLLTSLPYGMMGELITFHFGYPEGLVPAKAFSSFALDNSIYTNMLPSGQSFVVQNANQFITALPNPPPFGTPIPWLQYYGFNQDYAAAELSDPNTNGMPVWQEYIAGLNPRDPHARFEVRPNPPAIPGDPPSVTFSTVPTRRYRVEASTSMIDWLPLYEDIPGTGGEITVSDLRNLEGIQAIYYRVVVY